MTHRPSSGFDALLADVENENRARKFERETVHLPGTMEEALPFYGLRLRQHHAAMLSESRSIAILLLSIGAVPAQPASSAQLGRARAFPGQGIQTASVRTLLDPGPRPAARQGQGRHGAGPIAKRRNEWQKC